MKIEKTANGIVYTYGSVVPVSTKCSMESCEKDSAIRSVCWNHYTLVFRPTYLVKTARGWRS